jgi:hypothetical protein
MKPKLLYLGFCLFLTALAGWLGWFFGVQQGTAAAMVDSAIAVRIARETLADDNAQKASRVLDDQLEQTVLELGRIRHRLFQKEVQWDTDETILRIDKLWEKHPPLAFRQAATPGNDTMARTAVATVRRNLNTIIAEAKQRRASR